MPQYNKNKYFQQGTNSSPIQEILDLIAAKTNSQPKRYGQGYKLHCPAHEDKKPSFSISEGSDGRVLMHCFTGCSVEEICSSLGIHIRDLFPKKK